MRLDDILTQDTKCIFDNLCDFAEDIEISTHSANRRMVKGSLQSDLLNFSVNTGVNSPLCAYSVKLYIKQPEGMEIGVGSMLTVNRVAYRVDDKREDMGVLELSLSRGRW